MIHVFSEKLTSRVRYAFRLVFETVLNNSVEFHADPDYFSLLDGVKINYSEKTGIGGLTIRPSGLLFESGLQQIKIKVFDWEGLKAFFGVDNSILPFDIFSASFYLATRYEEYFPSERDEHQRFMSKCSLASKNQFLEKPLINCWALRLVDIIEREFDGFKFQRSKFSYIPTFDIDNAWAFKNKGAGRVILSSVNDLLHGRLKAVLQRISVLLNFEKDPYANYDFMEETMKLFSFKPFIFFLMNSGGKYDRAISFKNKAFQKLIKELSSFATIGIHPSYISNTNNAYLNIEVNRLEQVLGRKVELSRQHFLKLSFPETYQNLIDAEIKADYSKGYADASGFRASICTPYIFFDLLEEKETLLKIFPFQVMDVTLLNYNKMNTSDAIAKIESLMQETASVGGTFISLWHNESLSDAGQWKGWRQVYIGMTKMASTYSNG
jgi:hypothetical protein